MFLDNLEAYAPFSPRAITTLDETYGIHKTDNAVILGLRNAEFTDKLLEVLPKAKILKQLTTLDLSMGVLTDEGAKLLVQHADAYRHLEVLNVSDTYLSKAAAKTLKGVAKKVVADDLREDDDPEWRYPAVGE